MGASPSKAAINARIRRRLQTFARKHGGTYAKLCAQGVTDGLPWAKGVRVARASNGEVFGFDHIVIGEGEAARAYHFPDLETAVLAYRLETADPLHESDLFEGVAGDYKRLIGRRNPWNQTWGFKYAIGFNLDCGGFDLFNKQGETLPFRGEAADFWARDLWLNLPHMGAGRDRLKATRAERIAYAEAVDNFCEQFADAPNWKATADWRAKPDHYVSDASLPAA